MEIARHVAGVSCGGGDGVLLMNATRVLRFVMAWLLVVLARASLVERGREAARSEVCSMPSVLNKALSELSTNQDEA